MSRSSSKSSFDVPGPGHYIIDKSLEITEKEKHVIKIGNSRRFSSGYLRADYTPNGHKYNLKDAGKESSHRNLPKISFTKDKRFSKKKDR